MPCSGITTASPQPLATSARCPSFESNLDATCWLTSLSSLMRTRKVGVGESGCKLISTVFFPEGFANYHADQEDFDGFQIGTVHDQPALLTMLINSTLHDLFAPTLTRHHPRSITQGAYPISTILQVADNDAVPLVLIAPWREPVRTPASAGSGREPPEFGTHEAASETSSWRRAGSHASCNIYHFQVQMPS